MVGKNWIRTDIGDYDNPGFDDLTMSLAFLPDIKTESTSASGLPVFYKNKTDTHAKDIDGFTPRDYLTHWLSQWSPATMGLMVFGSIPPNMLSCPPGSN